MFETRPRSRRFYLTAAALLLAALAFDTLVWAFACRRLETGARDEAAAAGWTLSAGPAHWTGWPIAAEIILPDAVLRAGPDIIPPLTWTAPRAAIRLSAWHPTILTASAVGAQTLAIGTAPPVPFTAQRLLATIDLTAHDPAPGPVHVSIRVTAAVLDIAAPDGPVAIASADLRILPDGLTADLAGITLPDRSGQPITPPIDILRIDGRITPAIEPRPTAIESARRWRDAGGQLDLHTVAFRWGPLDATAHTILTLDRDLQPALSGDVTATGLQAVIERLAQTGAMARSTATATQGMLAILAAPSGGGPVTLPDALRDGVVSVARIPLLRLLPLQWD